MPLFDSLAGRPLHYIRRQNDCHSGACAARNSYTSWTRRRNSCCCCCCCWCCCHVVDVDLSMSLSLLWLLLLRVVHSGAQELELQSLNSMAASIEAQLQAGDFHCNFIKARTAQQTCKTATCNFIRCAGADYRSAGVARLAA